MKIIDVKEKTVPFSSLSVGDVCKIPWDDCANPTYAMKIETHDDGCVIFNAVDLEDGTIFEAPMSTQVIPITVELTVL